MHTVTRKQYTQMQELMDSCVHWLYRYSSEALKASFSLMLAFDALKNEHSQQQRNEIYEAYCRDAQIIRQQVALDLDTALAFEEVIQANIDETRETLTATSRFHVSRRRELKKLVQEDQRTLGNILTAQSSLMQMLAYQDKRERFAERHLLNK